MMELDSNESSMEPTTIIDNIIYNVVSKYWDDAGAESEAHSGMVINKKGASELASTMNLANSILGAGLLGLPWAISLSGYFLSIIFFIVFAFLAGMGLHLSMAAAKTLSPHSTYYTMSMASIPSAKKLVDASVAFNCFMSGCAYLVVIGDVVPQVIHEFTSQSKLDDNAWMTDRRFWIFIFCATLLFPIVALKKMDAFKYTSTLSLVCLAYITLIVILFASGAMDPESGHDEKKMDAFPSDMEFLQAIPIFLFAFTCHQNAFAITNEMKNNTLPRLNIVIFGSISSCSIVYWLIGFCGYYAYGDNVDQNILVSLPEIWPVAIVRITLALVMAWSFPMQLHPTRKSLAALLWNSEIEKISNVKFYVMTYTITLCSFGISMLVSSLGVVLSITGSVGCPIIQFILPGIFYYYLQDQRCLQEDEYYVLKRKMAMFMIVFGSLVIPFGLTVTFVYA